MRTRTIGILLCLGAMAASLAFDAQAQTAPPSAAISFTAPTKRTDGSNITGALTFEIWQGIEGATKTLVGTVASTNPTVTAGLLGGNRYCWHIVVKEAAGGASGASNEACKTFPVSGPQTVTITVQ